MLDDDNLLPDAVAQRNAVFRFFTGQDYSTVSSSPATADARTGGGGDIDGGDIDGSAAAAWES